MLVVALFSFWLCVFTLNLSGERTAEWSEASLLVPQAEAAPFLRLHAMSLQFVMETAKCMSETVLGHCPNTREGKLFSFRVKTS